MTVGDPILPVIDSLASSLALIVGYALYRGDPLLILAVQMINEIIWLGEPTDVDAVRFLDTGIVDIMDILLCDGNDTTDEEHTGQ